MLAEKGVSLTELMISSFIGILVIMAATRFSASLHHSLINTQLKAALEDELRSLQQLITQQIGRADYIDNSASLVKNPNLTKKMAPSTLKIGQFGSENVNSCITFSYDKKNPGHSELLGYRLHNEAIEYRVAGKQCSQGGWHDITDAKTTSITNFSLTLSSSTSWGKTIRVSIDAQSTINKSIFSNRQFVIGVPNAR